MFECSLVCLRLRLVRMRRAAQASEHVVLLEARTSSEHALEFLEYNPKPLYRESEASKARRFCMLAREGASNSLGCSLVRVSCSGVRVRASSTIERACSCVGSTQLERAWLAKALIYNV